MGAHLNHRYQLEDVVGAGGMGSVHRATDLRLGRTVAVKLLKGGANGDPVDRLRMRNEAQLAASIRHPGVAQVYDYDEDTTDGSTFIVMEYVEGHTLAALLRESAPLPVDQTMAVVQQVAEGLQAAHDAGIVHRDLKPANIMLTPAGRTVLLDFGIARTDTSEPLTDTGSLVGTTDYMSPEQARGQLATPQSDLYALGVVAYQCLTGASPFRRDSHVATALAQVSDDLPALPAEVPPAAADLVRALTAKDPGDRPASAADVARLAARVGAATVIDLPETFEMRAPATASPRTIGAAVADQVVHAPRRRRPRAVYAGLGMVVAVLTLLGGRELFGAEAPVVPDVVGATVQDAGAEVREAGLVPRTTTKDVPGKPEGQVVEQVPAAGAVLEEDDHVQLVVASGQVRVAADEVIGLSYARAARTLEELGLVVKRDEVTRTGDTGKVVAIDQSGRLPSGETVTLSVAVAPVPVAVAPAASATAPKAARTSPAKKPGPPGHAKGKGKGKGKG